MNYKKIIMFALSMLGYTARATDHQVNPIVQVHLLAQLLHQLPTVTAQPTVQQFNYLGTRKDQQKRQKLMANLNRKKPNLFKKYNR